MATAGGGGGHSVCRAGSAFVRVLGEGGRETRDSIDFLPTLKGGDSLPRDRGFPVSSTVAFPHQLRGGLTPSPQASTASPAARMFMAAFTSRSWTAPHRQVHSRMFNGNSSAIRPHVEQVLDDG